MALGIASCEGTTVDGSQAPIEWTLSDLHLRCFTPPKFLHDHIFVHQLINYLFTLGRHFLHLPVLFLEHFRTLHTPSLNKLPTVATPLGFPLHANSQHNSASFFATESERPGFCWQRPGVEDRLMQWNQLGVSYLLIEWSKRINILINSGFESTCRYCIYDLCMIKKLDSILIFQGCLNLLSK